MKKIIHLSLTFIVLMTMSNAHSQTCLLESEIPSTTPDSRFIDHNNGTISDVQTGLMWQKCQLGLSGTDCSNGNETDHTWQQALDEADSNTLANYNDWRLPNVKELLSIIEHRCYNPSINTTYFPNTTSSLFWSASPDLANADRSWRVFFSEGRPLNGVRINLQDVRLVRFEQ